MKEQHIPISNNYLYCQKGTPPKVKQILSLGHVSFYDVLFARPYLLFFTDSEIIFRRLHGVHLFDNYQTDDLTRYSYEEIDNLTVQFVRPMECLLQFDIQNTTYYFYFFPYDKSFNEQNFPILMEKDFVGLQNKQIDNNQEEPTLFKGLAKNWWAWLCLSCFILLAVLCSFFFIPHGKTNNAAAILLFSSVSFLLALFPPAKRKNLSVLSLILSLFFTLLTFWQL